MDAKQARADLPSVTVRLDEKIYPARVTGRLNPFATVGVCRDPDHMARYGTVPLVIFQAAWELIARSATNGTPINY